jgi:hypothetical protein
VWGDVAQTMYEHVSKCKNDKIKGKKCAIEIQDYLRFSHSVMGAGLLNSNIYVGR